jgi:hypothetical protein
VIEPELKTEIKPRTKSPGGKKPEFPVRIDIVDGVIADKTI